MFFRVFGAVMMVLGFLVFIAETPYTTPALQQLLISATGVIIGLIGFYLYDKSGGKLFRPERDYHYRRRW